MRMPLLPLHIPLFLALVINFIIGIGWWSQSSHAAVIVMLCALPVASALIKNAFAYSTLRAVALSCLIIILGAARYHYAMTTWNTNAQTIAGKVLDVKGEVRDLQSINSFQHVMILDLQEIKLPHEKQWSPATGSLCLHLRQPLATTVGDTIACTSLSFPRHYKDGYRSYLMKEGLIASLFPTNVPIELMHRPLRSLSRWTYELKQRVLTALDAKLSPETFALFATIFLGYKQLPKSDTAYQQNTFKQWGISHHLARSGLHLVMVIALLALFFGLAPLPLMLKRSTILCLILLYTFLSWSSISFLRALLTFLFYISCEFLALTVQAVHILCLVALLALLYNPLQLFALDFQLSFGLTFALAWLNHVAAQRRAHHLNKPLLS